MNKSLTVTKIGGIAMLQDNGRFGLTEYGIAESGALDKFAYSEANRLLENPIGATSIEIALGVFVVTAQTDTCIAVCGADLSFHINNKPAPLWQTINVKRNDVLQWFKRKSGLRCYLAVSGGFKVTPHLGSNSTNMRERIGGLNHDGTPLKIDDELPLESHNPKSLRTTNTQIIPFYNKHVTLRIIPNHRFDASFKEKFFSETYTITPQADRVAYRLQGQPLNHNVELPYSEGLIPGAVQIPPDGHPIVMLNDCPTIGGYPKIGTVLSFDLYKLAQTYSGDRVRFTPIDLTQAHQLRLKFNSFVDHPDHRKE